MTASDHKIERADQKNRTPIFVSPFSPIGRARIAVSADWLAAAVVVTLPWSTSAAGILIAALMVAVLLTLDRQVVAEHLARPGAYLPLLLWALMCVGMLWADVAWPARLEGLGHFHKLLIIPLLLIHFSRSARGLWIVGAFVASCVFLLIYSWAAFKWPALIWSTRLRGVPVKDYIYQNMAFVLSACILLHVAVTLARQKKIGYFALCGLLIMAFLANIAYVASSRTALISLPILLLVIGYQHFRHKGAVALVALFALFGSVAWTTSPLLRERVTALVEGTMNFQPDADTSETQRLEFWRKSAAAIIERPILGHGTGSIGEILAKSSQGERGAAGLVVRNPHNQTFALGIQAGIVGIALLYLMWLHHLLLFIGESWAARFGLLFVLQNVIGSMFNSHLSDFTAGWLYVFGVGILGGTVLNQQIKSRTQAGARA